MNEFYSYDIIVESFQDMQLSQFGKDKMGYFQTAMEAVANPQSQSVLLNKLYNDVQSISEIDFGKIPDTKGDLTKYQYYDMIYDSNELLDRLLSGTKCENLDLLNELHKILLNARDDFMYGFKTNDFLIKSTYNAMVYNLHEMINICIVDATEYLRQSLSMKRDKASAKKARLASKNVASFIKYYKSGQWNILMKFVRTNSGAKAFESMTMEISTEAIGDTLSQDNDPSKIVSLLGTAATATTKAVGNIAGLAGGVVAHPIKSFKAIPGIGGKIGAVIAAILGLLFILRNCTKYLYLGAANLSKSMRAQAQLLKAAAESDDGAGGTGIKFRTAIMNAMNSFADVIDYRLLKLEKDVSKEIDRSNRADYSRKEIDEISSGQYTLV